MVVEDHADTADLVRRALQSWLGIRCSSARTLAQATQLFQAAADEADDFDLVICDWVLPDGSGLQLPRMLSPRSEKRRFEGRTFLLSVSGMAALDDLQTSLAAGFDAHLRKPFTMQALVSVVHSLLAKSGCTDVPATA